MTKHTVDPVEFVETALEHLPDRPDDVGDEDFEHIAAIAAGATRYVDAVIARMRNLAQRVIDGETGQAVVDEWLWLQALHARSLQAVDRLHPYLMAAGTARGLDPKGTT